MSSEKARTLWRTTQERLAQICLCGHRRDKHLPQHGYTALQCLRVECPCHDFVIAEDCVMKDAALAADAALADDLEALAKELDSSLENHRKVFSHYIRGNSSVATVEHQLDRHDLGSEARMLRRAANRLRGR